MVTGATKRGAEGVMIGGGSGLRLGKQYQVHPVVMGTPCNKHFWNNMSRFTSKITSRGTSIYNSELAWKSCYGCRVILDKEGPVALPGR